MKRICFVVIVAVSIACLPAQSADKLTEQERIELLRGLNAEYATVKDYLPRSKKPLAFEADGNYDRAKWSETARTNGPAARAGDLVQITKVALENDKIVLDINGGMKSGKHWYDHVQIGMGSQSSPISNGNITATTGTSIEILFHHPLTSMTAADVKKILAPVLDFEKRSATQLYSETLTPEVKKAIQEKRAEKGMDKDQVVLALGRPEHKERQTIDGTEYEDWIYGKPPGKITFVTFSGDKVVKIKDAYAGLGAEAAAPVQTPR